MDKHKRYDKLALIFGSISFCMMICTMICLFIDGRALYELSLLFLILGCFLSGFAIDFCDKSRMYGLYNRKAKIGLAFSMFAWIILGCFFIYFFIACLHMLGGDFSWDGSISL